MALFTGFTLFKMTYFMDCKPLARDYMNKIELLNETKTYFVGFFLTVLEYIFSTNGLFPDYDNFVSLGYVIFGLEMLIIVINILLIAFFILRQCRKSYYKVRRKHGRGNWKSFKLRQFLA